MAALLALSLVSVVLALWAAYTALPKLAKGWPRFILVFMLLPVLAWPALTVQSIYARAVTVFILLWVCPSKLLAFAMDAPIDVLQPGSFFQFAIASLLPLRVLRSTHNRTYPNRKLDGSVILVLQVAIMLTSANYIHLNRDRVSWWIIGAAYCIFIYLNLEITMAVFAKIARFVTKLEMAPSFNNPFLASSLSEFWGRRWNLLVNAMLRATVYDPVVRFLTPVRSKYTSKPDQQQQKNVRPLFARSVGTLASFVVSGLFHEAIFCVINQSTQATWEVTLFFVIHGVATVVEAFFRKRVFNYKPTLLTRPLFILLTLGFMYLTVVLLFLPPVTRTGSDVKTLEEIYRLQSLALDLFRFNR